MQAIFSYKAAHADELTFEEGAIITVIGRDEPEWWRGRLHSTGAEGLFPMNYVRPYNPAIHDGNVNLTKSSESSQQSKKSSTPGGSNSPRPAELVDRLILADPHLDLKHRTRDLIIKELISTEEAYAVDLLEVQTVFLEPLSKSGLLTSHQINRIFSNWVALYQFSLEFHRALAGYLDDSSNRDLTDSQFNLGKVLLQQIPKFGVFRQYCTNQDAASQFLQRYLVANEPLQLLVQDCERKTRTKGLPLSSYLLKPLQRLTKYRLFLDRILENTDPSESCFGAIQEAHTQLVAALGQIDGAVGSRLANRRIAWLRNHLISGDRASLSWLFGPFERSAGNREQLLYYGTLHKAKSNRELVVFLFTRFLLLTTPGYSTGGQPFEFSFDTTEANNTLKMYKQPISLAEIVVSVGTSLRSLEVSKLYNSLSVLPAVRSRSVSAVENQNGFRAIPSCSSLSNFSVTGFADDIPVQSTMHTIQPTFSLFLRSNPEHPLIVLKASNTKERDRWVTHIWKAIRNPVKCFPPSSLLESPSRLPFDPERKAGQLLVSVVRSWTSNKNPVSICLEFAMDDQPTQTCTLLSDSPSQSMAPLCFMYSNSEHSCLSVSARNSLESSMPRTAGHFRLQISCLLKLVDTTTSDPGIIKRDSQLVSDLNLAPDFRDDYPELFNIILWTSIVLILIVWGVSWGIWNMDPGRDGIIYRGTAVRPKRD
ncbi:hypothetical protein PHET_07184 [Paragonimus heterotremus]|uniref:Uncharacterized protein n=1 Tax=Paragonimus heterotremus TaxID=100268 RepID=A0A8J4T0E9_9TREM|nr:hypothetical protein PHET_07184 [Paragonimus heterotremus]